MVSKGPQNDTNPQHKLLHMGSTPLPFIQCVKNIRFGRNGDDDDEGGKAGDDCKPQMYCTLLAWHG